MEKYETLEIFTPRLILRVPRMEDAQEMQAAKEAVWPELQKWMSWAYDGEETMEATYHFVANAPENNFLIGVCRDSGRFIISTGIAYTKYNEDQVETGYWVAKDFLGKGYATEATNAVIRYGFNALAARSVYICHYEGNEPSRRVIEKLGFTKTGLKPEKHNRCLDGTPLNVHEFVMTDPSVLPPLDVSWRHRCP